MALATTQARRHHFLGQKVLKVDNEMIVHTIRSFSRLFLHVSSRVSCFVGVGAFSWRCSTTKTSFVWRFRPISARNATRLGRCIRAHSPPRPCLHRTQSIKAAASHLSISACCLACLAASTNVAECDPSSAPSRRLSWSPSHNVARSGCRRSSFLRQTSGPEEFESLCSASKRFRRWPANLQLLPQLFPLLSEIVVCTMSAGTGPGSE